MLNLDMMGEMKEKEKVNHDLVKVQQIYRAKKAAGKNQALMKAAFSAFTCDVLM